jgi:hypothetical protein
VSADAALYFRSVVAPSLSHPVELIHLPNPFIVMADGYEENTMAGGLCSDVRVPPNRKQP